MKKILSCVMFLFFLFVASATLVERVEKVETGGGLLSGTDISMWVKNWQLLGVMAILISVSMVALGYMLSIGFNLRGLRAWSDTELVQVFGSALLLGAIIGALSISDTISDALARGSDLPAECTYKEPCSITVAKVYLDNIINVTNKAARNTLEQSITYGKKASKREGFTTTTQYTLWLGASRSRYAGYRMYVERYSIIFEMLSNLLASLHAQKSFLSAIALGIGPVLLLFGIVLRTFFFSRKLGGLLLAIALGLMVIYPLLYVLSWFTLNITTYGDEPFKKVPIKCPDECELTPPENGTITGVSCTDKCTVGGTECPVECREIPLPIQNPGCTTDDVQKACYTCPQECKIVRARTDCDTYCKEDICPKKDCRVVLPNETSDCIGCIGCPFYCRVLLGAGLPLEQPGCPTESGEPCHLSKCPANCRVILPPADCEEQCAGCPEGCMVNINETKDEDNYIYGHCSTIPSCKNCPARCKATPIEDKPECAQWDATQDPTECRFCPEICRWTPAEFPATPHKDPTNLRTSYPEEPTEPSCFTSATSLGCTTGNCPEHCRIGWTKNCSEYDETGHEDRCGHCPVLCRIGLLHDGGYIGHMAGCPSHITDDVCEGGSGTGKCPEECKTNITIPPTSSTCLSYDENAYDKATRTIRDAGGNVVNNPKCVACPEQCRLKQLPPEDLVDNPELNVSNCSIKYYHNFWSYYKTDITHALSDIKCTPSKCRSATPCTNYSCCMHADYNNFREHSPHSCDNETVYDYGGSKQCEKDVYDACLDSDTSTSTVSAGADVFCRQHHIGYSCIDMRPTCEQYSCNIDDYIGCWDSIDCENDPGVTGGCAKDVDNSDFVCIERITEECNIDKYQGCTVISGTTGAKTSGSYSSEVAGECEKDVRSYEFTCTNATGDPKSCTVDECHDCINYNSCSCGAGETCVACDPASDILYCHKPNEYPCGSATEWKDCGPGKDCLWQGDAEFYCLNASPKNEKYECLETEYGACVSDFTCDKGVEGDFKYYCINVTYYCFYAGCIPGTVCNSYSCPLACKNKTEPIPAPCLPYVGPRVCKTGDFYCAHIDKCCDDDYCTAGCYPPISPEGAEVDIRGLNTTWCRQCPDQCRINGTVPGVSGLFEESNCGGIPDDAVACRVGICPNFCRSEPPPIDGGCQNFTLTLCAGCPLRCRIRFSSPGDVAPGCDIDACTDALCPPSECKVKIPENTCDRCIECDEDCTHIPPIRTNCLGVCEETELSMLEPPEFNRPGGAPGSQDVANVGGLFLPAFILPIFNIVITIAFIRVLSPVLGGAIEIPGLPKLI